MLLEVRQYVNDLWIENSIPSFDFTNGRDNVKMGYTKYDHQYPNRDKHPTQEKAKCVVKVYVATHRAATCTTRKLKFKIFSEKGINISISLL